MGGSLNQRTSCRGDEIRQNCKTRQTRSLGSTLGRSGHQSASGWRSEILKAFFETRSERFQMGRSFHKGASCWRGEESKTSQTGSKRPKMGRSFNKRAGRWRDEKGRFEQKIRSQRSSLGRSRNKATRCRRKEWTSVSFKKDRRCLSSRRCWICKTGIREVPRVGLADWEVARGQGKQNGGRMCFILPEEWRMQSL